MQVLFPSLKSIPRKKQEKETAKMLEEQNK
jgi:hypothetical protein